MKKNYLLIIILLSIVNVVFSQEEVNQASNNNKVEDYIITKQLDSAYYFISKEPLSSYLQALKRIATKNNPSNLDYYQLVNNIGARTDVKYELVSNYINAKIKIPANKKVIDTNYVKIKWLQISKLRDEVTVSEASIEQTKLEAYINQFNKEHLSVVKSKLRVSTHQLVLYTISKDVEKGKALCLENLKKAKVLNDKELSIVFLYHLCDFLIYEGKLDEYIDTSEQSLLLESKLNKKTSYYTGTIIHLLDAYIYKQGYENRVLELLNQLYENPQTRVHSYSLYAKWFRTLPVESPIAVSIFKKFEVTNLIDFCEAIKSRGKDVLNPNDFYHVLNESAYALAAKEFYIEGLDYMSKCVELTKKIYSEDLAQSLANSKIALTVKEKDLEIKHEQERTNLYFIIVLLVAGLSGVSMFAFFRKRKQSKILEQKNTQINKTLKEKELLIKEVHHRVKNNFQIVSSLLELQTKDIEDKKALKLVNEGKNRVQSMALIHEKLYQNENGLIDFEEYILLLVKELSNMYAFDKKIKTKTESGSMFFDLDTAIPLGLIINELITNAYKYAFLDKKDNELNISINKLDSENYKLIVSDNGVGLDSSFNINKANSLGLRLVSRLVKQLHGKLSFVNDNGANFEIVFKDIHARRNID